MFNRLNILKMLDNKNWSKYKLAKEAGIPQSSLHDILSGKIKNPTAERLKSIADALDVSVNDFFDSENSDIKKTNQENKCEMKTIAAHLEGKNITPQKMKLLEKYIDALFDDE